MSFNSAAPLEGGVISLSILHAGKVWLSEVKELAQENAAGYLTQEAWGGAHLVGVRTRQKMP